MQASLEAKGQVTVLRAGGISVERTVEVLGSATGQTAGLIPPTRT